MQPLPHTRDDRARHWDRAYAGSGSHGVSWYQPEPLLSLELIAALGIEHAAPIVDVGGGASTLADRLVERDFADVTVVDIAHQALAETRARLAGSKHVVCLEEDILAWVPQRRYDLWHDRAVFHFLVAPAERAAYLDTLRTATSPGAGVVLGTFAPDGPDRCSGLPVERYSANDLTDLLGPAFTLVERGREEHVTPAGTIQPFTWIAGRLSA